MRKAVLGLDFGTLSARAVLADPESGKVIAEETENYRYGVMEKKLHDAVTLPEGSALADVHDYETVLEHIITGVVKKAGIPAEDIIGIGIDCTSSTFLPLDKCLKPMQDDPRFQDDPHAYMKLWKHHGAISEADRLTEKMLLRKESFSDRTGRKINAEWMLPKLLEICEKDPEIYKEIYCFLETGDYLSLYLTGELTRSASIYGYKMAADPGDGSRADFYASVSEAFRGIEEKLPGRFVKPGEIAGRVTPEMASKLGLKAGTPVAAPMIDAHSSLPAGGITGPGEMMIIVGTTCCAIVCDREAHFVPGISGCVMDGVLPGLYCYEAGQSAVGDVFQWFTDHCVPEAYEKKAEESGMTVQQYLTELAMKTEPGETGLLALDWWNGCRSPLGDASLSGLIMGMDLTTKPEHIYRALLESIAFGLRRIRDTYEENGVKISAITACGGIPQKNPLLMQLYADICGCEVRLTETSQASALGAAVFASAAAGSSAGGYDSIEEAARHMGRTEEKAYYPLPAHEEIYEELYRVFESLSVRFGTGEDRLMNRLKGITKSEP